MEITTVLQIILVFICPLLVFFSGMFVTKNWINFLLVVALIYPEAKLLEVLHDKWVAYKGGPAEIETTSENSMPSIGKTIRINGKTYVQINSDKK